MPSDGRYRATKNSDGTFTVHDVEIFAEVKPGTRQGLPKGLDGDWVRKAAERAISQHARGYLPPVHRLHNEKDVKPEFAGNLRVTRVGSFEYEGETLTTIYADLENVPASVFERIQSGALPHRSVEILTIDPPELRSLALLDTDVPHFQFPNLTVRLNTTCEVLDRVTYRAAAASRSPVRAVTEAGTGAALLFKFEAPEKKDDEKKSDGAKDEKGGDESKPKSDEDKAGVAGLKDDDADESGDEDGADGADVPVGDAAAVQNEANILAEINGKLDRLFVLLGAADVARPNAQPDDGMEPVDANRAGKMRAISATLSALVTHFEAKANSTKETKMPDEKKTNETQPADKSAEQFADLRGKIAALEAENQKRAERDAVESMVAAAVKELKGFNVTDGVRADLAHFAALGKAHVDRFVASFKANSVADGARTLDEFEQRTQAATDSPEVLKFAAKGDAALKAARDVAKEHAVLRERAPQYLPPLDRYLKSHPATREFATA